MIHQDLNRSPMDISDCRECSTTDLGNQVIWHNGGIDGYSSFVGFNPDEQIGLVILCSCYFTDVPPIEMLNIAVLFFFSTLIHNDQFYHFSISKIHIRMKLSSFVYFENHNILF